MYGYEWISGEWAGQKESDQWTNLSFFLYDDVITNKMCVCMLSNSHEYGWCSLGCDGDAPGGASDVEGNRDSVDTTSSSSVCLCWILSVLRCGTSKKNTPLKNS